MLVHEMVFKVNGVTFENDEGKNIQKEIKRILKEYKANDYFDKLYEGYTNKEIIEEDLLVSEYEGYTFESKLVGDEYNGEECLKIYFKTYNDEFVHVGYAPKEKLEEIAEWLNKKDLKVDGQLEVTGGKYKHTGTYEEDYEEKEKIVVEELTYGLEITLKFYDNSINPEISKNRDNEDKDDNKFFYTRLFISFALIGLIIFLISKWLFNGIMNFLFN